MIKKNITSSFSVFMDFTYHNLTSVKTWVSKWSLTLNHSLLLKVNMTHVTLPKSNASSDLCHKWSAALKSPRRPSNYGCSYKRHLGMTTLSTLSVVVATLPGAGSKGDKWTGRASKQTLTPHLSVCLVPGYTNTLIYTLTLQTHGQRQEKAHQCSVYFYHMKSFFILTIIFNL